MFKFSQQVINAILSQYCHSEKKETLQEFGVLLLLSHLQGHGSESIDHYGASKMIESPTAIANGGTEAKVSCMRRQAGWGERCRCMGQIGGRKAILRSLKELLFHGKLKSHYKDYMAANNVRQISI